MRYVALIIISFLYSISCKEKKDTIVKIAGEAQGTTYHISYLSEGKKDYKAQFDSILRDIDTSMSTYLPVSIISRINKNDTTVIVDKYFTDVFYKSIEVSERTGGLFDVTVGPLVNAWGFGFTKKANVDSAMLDSLRQLVGYKMVNLEGNKLIKQKPQIILDFNAIAQGYSVDVLCDFLESRGINNYLVELGGELKAKGRKNNNEPWKVGIDQPNENPTDDHAIEAIIILENKALSTSGNYRKFYVEDGQRYAHIIDPRTGYPARQNVLSATVVADDCTTADAYATAFMVMGLEKSKQFLAENKDINLEVYFIYDEKGSWKTYTSDNLKKWIEEVH